MFNIIIKALLSGRFGSLLLLMLGAVGLDLVMTGPADDLMFRGSPCDRLSLFE